MQIIRHVSALREAVRTLKAGGKSVALAPTMGALHHGHIALVAEGAKRADHVVASLFVNPKQFGPNEDLARYPRREAEDLAALEAGGCAIAWVPDVAEMYPQGFATTISIAGISSILDGAARPGHFDGVATVVTKLFNQVRPEIAVFGEKDYQQLVLIRRLVDDLDLGIEIVGAPIVRDEDGLALSSRNIYLSDRERLIARVLPRLLGDAAVAFRLGAPAARVRIETREALLQAGFDSVDYIELCDAATLLPLDHLGAPARLLAAARIGGTRLIDNLSVTPD